MKTINRNKLIITGSSGMLGKDLINHFAQSKSFEIFGFDLYPGKDKNAKEYIFDITDLELLKKNVAEINPHYIIHAAAIVNLNVCDKEPELANKLHIDVSRELAKYKVKTIYISTDSVFNGMAGNYKENDIPDPLNNYARTKFLGELAIQANNLNHIIIRTNIFGFNIPLKNSLAEWAIKSFEENKEVNGFDDVYFNAIYTKQLAIIIEKLIDYDFKGMINIGSSTSLSKYDFLCHLAESIGYSKEKIIRSSIYNNEFKTIRPTNTTLNLDFAKKHVPLPTMKDGIQELAKDYKRLTNA